MMSRSGAPRVAVVVSHPIQYFSPIFDNLEMRKNVELSVYYGNDAGMRPYFDSGFGLVNQWDVDLVSGHRHLFLTHGGKSFVRALFVSYARLLRYLRSVDVVIIHGYVSAAAVAAILVAWTLRKPFLLRTDTSSRTVRRRWSPKDWWPRLVCRTSAGAMSVGIRNAEVLRDLGVPRCHFAPFAVDDRRFSLGTADAFDRDAARLDFGLPADGPVAVYAGKLQAFKCVADLIQAAQGVVHVFVIGTGEEEGALRLLAAAEGVTFAGFVNQAAMPAALACADIVVLPSEREAWGLAVNEAMSAGCLPIVSDRVGCAPDLVEGVGWVFPVGDVSALRAALHDARAVVGDASASDAVKRRISQYSMTECVGGYERAVVAALGS